MRLEPFKTDARSPAFALIRIILSLTILLTACTSQQANAVHNPVVKENTISPSRKSTSEVKMAKVQVDFNITVDPPLVKKFGVMNSGLVPVSRYRRDAELIKDIKPESLRIDIGWGWKQSYPNFSWNQEMVSGQPGNLSYNFREVDELARLLLKQDVLPYWSYCYVPVPLQKKPEVWNQPPTNLDAWQEILKIFADHFRQEGIKIAYQEVYNEPDLFNVFFTGTSQQYFEMYKAGATGIRQGDPDAMVGGPALAYKKGWVTPFLDYVEKNNLPLDFFSFHTIYPGSTDFDWNTAQKRVEMLRKYFANRPRFDTTEWHMNEFHPYEANNTKPGGKADRFYAAATIFQNFQEFLEDTDLTLVNWAQAMSSIEGAGDVAMGLINLNGQRRASYNAFEIYARMPVDRRQAEVEGSIGSMASVDLHRASIVIWNQSDEDLPTTVEMMHLPFSDGSMQVFRIDQNHASVTDHPDSEQLEAVEKITIKSSNPTWTGILPGDSVVYLEIESSSIPEPARQLPLDKLIRIHYYYPNRGSTAYAEFDRRTWIARLGTGTNSTAYSLVGAEFQDLGSELSITLRSDGQLQLLDKNSLAGVRIDYQSEGEYKKSVLFHTGIYNDQRDAVMPWGTKRQADQVIHIINPNNFQIDLASYAPPGWDGRIIVSSILKNTGPNTRLTVEMGVK